MSKRLGFLRAGHPVLAVDHEKWHALDAKVSREGDIRLDIGQILIRFKCADHVSAVEADLGGKVGEILDASDRQPSTK